MNPGSLQGLTLTKESPLFSFNVPAGNLARIKVSARDVDLALCLYSSKGDLVAEQDGLWSTWETENATWHSERADVLTLVILTISTRGASRRYDLQTELVSNPSPRALREARALATLARADLALRRVEPSYEKLLTDALRLWKSLANAQKIAEVEFRLGEHFETDAPEEAERHFHEAFKGFTSTKQVFARAWTSRRLAGIEERSRRYVESSEHLEISRRGFESLGAQPETAEVLEAQARLSRLLGQSDVELQFLQRAASQWNTLGLKGKEAEVILNEGQVLARWGRSSEALDRYEVAWERMEDQDDIGQAARIRTARGQVLARLGQAEAARKELDTALALWHRINDDKGSVAALTGLCFALRQLGQFQKAYSVCQRAMQISQIYGPPDYAARTRYSVGLSLREAGRLSEALPLFREVRNEARALSDRDLEAACLLATARSEHALGNFQAASDHARLALEVLESARLGSDVLDLRTSFLGDRSGYYDFAVDLHLEMAEQSSSSQELEIAFEFDERYRARGLLDLVVAGRRRATDTQSREFRNVEASLLAAIERTGQYGTAQDEVADAWRRYSLQIKALTAAGPIQSTGISTLNDIQQLLDNETLLIQIRLRRGRSLCWVVTHDNLLVEYLPAGEQLSDIGQRALLDLASPPVFAKKGDYALVKLSQEILGPLTPFLQHHKRLVVVADGFLQGFPWAALLDPKRLRNGDEKVPLLERFEITQVPSSSLLVALARRQHPVTTGIPKILALGNPLFAKPGESGQGWPPLPATEGEVRALEAAAGNRAHVTLALGTAASRQTLFEADWPTISVLHLATHAEVNGNFPYLSRLALAERSPQGKPVDGSFFAFEALQLPLRADLTVLSGCQTAQGEILPSEGVVGLSYAFLAAGTDRVLASLWPVADAPTAELIAAFYRFYLSAGLSEASSLRAAQQELRRRGAPEFVWASFILQGRLSPSPRSKQMIARRTPFRPEHYQRGSYQREVKRHETIASRSRIGRGFSGDRSTRLD